MEFSRRRMIGALGVGCVGAASLLAPRPLRAATMGSFMQRALLGRAKDALDRYGDLIPYRDSLAIVDFTAASGVPRLRLVDLYGGFETSFLVAHGSGSDPDNSGWVNYLSNVPGSNASCGGAFVTSDIYAGKHGRSRRLTGLEPENDLAEERGIVIHGASYVNVAAANLLGRVGRSQGCFAVSQSDVGEVLQRLGSGRLLFAAR